MNPWETIHNNVYRGLVLNRHGQWVGLNDAIAYEDEISRRLALGQVYNDGQWISIDDAILKENDTPQKSPPKEQHVEKAKKTSVSEDDYPREHHIFNQDTVGIEFNLGDVVNKSEKNHTLDPSENIDGSADKPQELAGQKESAPAGTGQTDQNPDPVATPTNNSTPDDSEEFSETERVVIPRASDTVIIKLDKNENTD